MPSSQIPPIEKQNIAWGLFFYWPLTWFILSIVGFFAGSMLAELVSKDTFGFGIIAIVIIVTSFPFFLIGGILHPIMRRHPTRTDEQVIVRILVFLVPLYVILFILLFVFEIWRNF